MTPASHTHDMTAVLEASRVVEAVIRIVAHRYRLTPLQLTGRGQTSGIVQPRHLAMVLCVRLSGATYAQIGQRFTGRAYTTHTDEVLRAIEAAL